jgi:hypothetical protein
LVGVQVVIVLEVLLEGFEVVVSEFIVDQLTNDGVLLVRDSLPGFVGVRPTEMFRVGQLVFAGEVQYVLDHMHLQPIEMVLNLDLVQESVLESLAGAQRVLKLLHEITTRSGPMIGLKGYLDNSIDGSSRICFFCSNRLIYLNIVLRFVCCWWCASLAMYN